MSAATPERHSEFDVGTPADALKAVMHFLRAVRYHRAYLVSCLLVVAALGSLYYLTATRRYRATASLLITPSGPVVWDNAAKADSGRDNLLPTYEKLFSSAVVLQGAVERLQRMPPGARVDLRGVREEKFVETLRDNLSARAIRATNIIDLGYVSLHPKAAEAVVDAVVQSYLDFMDKNHRDVSVEIVSKLHDERRDVEQRLRETQQRYLELQRAAGDLGLQQEAAVVHPLIQRVVQLNEDLVEVQKQRIRLESSLTAVRTAVRGGGDLRQHLLSMEPIVGREMVMSLLGLNPQTTEIMDKVEQKLLDDRARLQTLRAHYGPAHPQVVELIEQIANAERYLREYSGRLQSRLEEVRSGQLGPMLVSMLEEDLAKTLAHERELGREYDRNEQAAVQLNDRLAELQLVHSDLQRMRNLHDTLLDRIAKLDINREQADVRVAVVSEPRAQDRPVTPRFTFTVMLCLVAGLGSGAALVYIRDLLDDRFRSPEELREQLGVPVLAMIRKLQVTAETGLSALQVHIAPQAVESEAFRTLRTALAFSGQDLCRLAVSSPEPSDGKTTVVANLAVALAQAGKRTLLIDADLRRPGLTRLFELRRSAGLTELLRGTEELATAAAAYLHQTGVGQLTILPCGARPADPAELLASQRMEELVGWAESHFDIVLIDCPPLMAASDAAIIGRKTDGILLVVQPEKNHRRQVIRAVESLTSMQVPVLGVVANRISEDKESGYYGYGYGYGADAQDEFEELDVAPAAGNEAFEESLDGHEDSSDPEPVQLSLVFPPVDDGPAKEPVAQSEVKNEKPRRAAVLPRRAA